MIRIFFVMLFLYAQSLVAQNYFSENERFYQLTNGLELLLVQNKDQDEVIVAYSSKAGAYTETDDLDGVTKFYSDLFFIKNNENPSTINNQEYFKQGILQSTDIGEEHVSFILNFTDENILKTALGFLKKQLEDTSITQGAIDYTSKRLSRSYRPNKAEALLWGEYYNRVNLQINPDSINDNLKGKLKTVQERNFCPQNSLLVISGDIDFKQTLELVQNSMGGLKKCGFNYFSQYPIPSTDPLRYNQQIVSYERTNFRAEYHFQGPTFRDDLTSLLAVSVLNQLLKDKYGRNGISININTLYYATNLSLTVKADNKEDFLKHYETLQKDFLGNGMPDFINDALVADFQEKMSVMINTILDNPVLKITMMRKLWASKDIHFFTKMMEELNEIKTADINNMIRKYIKNNNYVLKLVVPEPGQLSDSLEIETGSSLDDYELMFKRNSGELLNAAQDSILKNLTYFLKLNPKSKVKIVGLASKSEITEYKDKDTYKMVKDEFEGFNIHPASLRPSSSKIRLDIYRSIKIAEKLYNSGIALNRLFGSGRLEQEDKEEYYKVYFREMGK